MGSEAWKLNYERQRFVTQHAVKTLKASFKRQRSDLSHMYGARKYLFMRRVVGKKKKQRAQMPSAPF